MMSTLCAYLLVISMWFVYVDVHARPKRVSNPIKANSERIYIPANASFNDGWIPIPMHVIEESNDTDLKKGFVLVYMYSNETYSPGEDDKPAPPSLPVGVIFIISLTGGAVAVLIVYVIAEIVLRQKQNQRNVWYQNGQASSCT